jgi:hypothetical protein
VHEQDLDGRVQATPRKIAAPERLGDCVAGDVVEICSEKHGAEEVVVANATLSGGVWVRPLDCDGREGEFQHRSPELRVTMVRMR